MPEPEKHRFSDYFYNYITYAGALLAIVIFSIEAMLFGIDYFSSKPSLYLGLITYFLLPPFLFLGLLLIPAGALWKRHRVIKGLADIKPEPIHIDLSKASHRNALFVFIAVTAMVLIASTIGSYESYHYTESVSFCGQLCHDVMKPEFTAYQHSAHARVKCVDCHIGEGAGWFVKSKVSGAYQMYAVAAGNYPRPISTPIKNLRPARETCERCHWPEHFFSSKERVFRHFLSDEKNTPWTSRMLMHIGGGGPKGVGQTGIHWHMVIHNNLKYVASSKDRQGISWVKVTDKDGKVIVYSSESNPPSEELLKPENQRSMDCMDCHNRPSHRFPSPAKAVDHALAGGELDPTLPFIKAQAVKALAQDYAGDAEAREKIAEGMRAFYAKENPARVEGAISEIQKIYARIQFPHMKANWKAYPENIGHMEYPGCFRCHGSDLKSPEGKTISRDCNVCHTILSQGSGPEPETLSAKGLEFEHPVDVGVDMKEADCNACHTGGPDLY